LGEARKAVERVETPPAGEIRALTKFAVPKLQVYSRLSLILIFSIFLLPHVLETPSLLITWTIFLVVVGWPFILLWRLTKKPVDVSLRMEGRYLYLRMGSSFTLIIPKRVEWRNPSSFSVRSGRKRTSIDFPSPTEAARAYRLIVDNFPEVQVQYVEGRPVDGKA